eukprot:221705-Ditylum_brightwellii.AAC.1
MDYIKNKAKRDMWYMYCNKVVWNESCTINHKPYCNFLVMYIDVPFPTRSISSSRQRLTLEWDALIPENTTA